MLAEDTPKPATRLVLDSRLAEIAKLWPWVDVNCARYSVPSDTLFAIHLCLEEAVSNIVRHGYSGRPGQQIVVEFEPESETDFVFIIEDHAPPFDPRTFDTSVDPKAPSDLLIPGGHGIRLLRRFSGQLHYLRLTHGNRLSIRFSVP